MRIGGAASPAINRRRGTRGGSSGGGGGILSLKALVVLGMICISIFALGLVLGARTVSIAVNDPSSATGADGKPQPPKVGPATAAGQKVDAAAKEIHRLVAESARAEAIRLKAAAVKIGKGLRGRKGRGNADADADGDGDGVPHPGDPNYNPHHSIDDDDHGAGGGGGGDGGGGEDEEEAAADDDKEDVVAKEFERRMEKGDEGKGGGGGGGGKGGGGSTIAFGVDMFPPDNVGKDDYPAKYMSPPVPSSGHDFSSYRPLGGDRFVEWKDGETPYAITPALLKQSDDLARSRRDYVKKAMEHAWSGYKKHAFGQDEVLPQSGKSHSNWGGMGTTLVDSLDTLWLMGMKEEFTQARDWVRDHLDHDHVHKSISVFETTIRSLGGLLSAYDWSGDKAFLDKANDLGARLFKSFQSPSGIPFGSVNINDGRASNFGWAGNNAILSEFTTIQVEYRYLARATGKKEYADKAERVYELMKEIEPSNGLYPLYVRNTGEKPSFANQKISFGAMGDSFYEYMLKIWLQGGKKESMYREMYDRSIQGMHDELLFKSTPTGLTYIADKVSGRVDHKMDHLVCFMGGLLALGAYTDPQGFDSTRAQRDLKTAKELTYTCYQMYARMKTGISPEFVAFGKDSNDFTVGHNAAFYILRPETVESFFVLNQLTGDPAYREWGWEVFQSIERYCRTDIAYGSLTNVNNPGAAPEDRMESFFLAETIKYLYLLFDPDTEVDIVNKHVFNTEAHPMRILPEFDKSPLALK